MKQATLIFLLSLFVASASITAPIPGVVWILGLGLIGLFMLLRRTRAGSGFLMALLLIGVLYPAQGFAGFYKFTGSVDRITGNTVYLTPFYAVGDTLTFVFEIDESTQGTFTNGYGDTLMQGGDSFYAEYLGGDAVLLEQIDAYVPTYQKTILEYNAIQSLTPSNWSEAGMLTESYSNRINVTTTDDYAPYNTWKDHVGKTHFKMNQLVTIGELSTNTAAYFIDDLTLVEYSSELTGLNLTGVAMKATPIPGAVWLLGSGLFGLVGLLRRTKT